MREFKGKTVVITGGATGIGFSFAKQFGRDGARVIIAGRRENRLKETVESLRGEGIAAESFRSDVVSRSEVEALADFAWKTFGSVDVLVNNAVVSQQPLSLLDATEEVFRRVYDVNIFGVLNGIAVFGKRFVEQGTPAAIYNVGSENSLFNGVPLSAAYVSSKHAVLAISEALREEIPDFIKIGLICPGFVRSELADAEIMRAGMDTDRFTDIAMDQIRNGEFYIVSHAYNIVRIDERHDQVSKAFERYAPRYEGDDEFDVRTLIERMSPQASEGH